MTYEASTTVGQFIDMLEQQHIEERERAESEERRRLETQKIGEQLHLEARSAISTYVHKREKKSYLLNNGGHRYGTYTIDSSFPIIVNEDTRAVEIWLSQCNLPGASTSLSLHGRLLNKEYSQDHTIFIFNRLSCTDGLGTALGTDSEHVRYVSNLLKHFQIEAQSKLLQDVHSIADHAKHLLDRFGVFNAARTSRETAVIRPQGKTCEFSLVQFTAGESESDTPIVLRIHREGRSNLNFEPYVTITESGVSGVPHSDKLREENTSKVLWMAQEGLTPLSLHYGMDPISTQGIPTKI